MKKLWFLLVIIIASQQLVLSQLDASLEKLRTIIPPSPNASSIAKYGEWPVSLYTGIPSINVPVYELKGRSVSVPINLSYHTSGIRVGEVASLVGLGWSLNAGGAITRSVKGLPDEDSYFGYAQYYSNPNDFSSSSTNQVQTFTQGVKVANNNADSQLDDYRLNVFGKSYALMLAANGTVYTRPFSNIKITTSFYNGNNSWNVVLEDGTKLLFGGNDNCTETNLNTSFGSTSGIIPYTSSWYLQTITSPVGEVIQFRYQNAGTVDQDLHIYQSDFIQYQCIDSVLNWVQSYQNFNGIASSNGTRTDVKKQSSTQIYISSIESDNTRVDFVLGTNRRDDLSGEAYRLESIKVFSKLANAYIDTYTFNYNYSTCAPGNEYISDLSAGTANYMHKRLKLLSLSHNGNPSTSNQPEVWRFEYNPQSLPSRRSYAQDHWGFYNGALGNTTFLPRVYYALPLPAPGNQYDDSYASLFGFFPKMNTLNANHEFGADKYPNENAMQAEILTKIKYPTGGYSQFTYEANQSYVNREILSDTTVTLSLFNEGGLQTYTDSVSFNFTITQPQYVFINQAGVISGKILADVPGAKFYYIITNLTTGKRISLGAGSMFRWLNLLTTGNYSLVIKSNLTADNFSIAADFISVNTSFRFSPSWGFQNAKTMYGGLRIKTITNYDGLTNQTSTKSFLYDSVFVINPIDTLRDYLSTQSIVSLGSSFSQNTDISFDIPATTVVKTGNTTNYYASTLTQTIPGSTFNNSLVYGFNKITRSSITKFSLGAIQGGTVGYGKVTVIDNNANENGTTVSRFSNVSDDNTAVAKIFPYSPTDSREWRRGLLLDESVYNNNNILLKKTTHNYSFGSDFSVKNFVAGYKTSVDGSICGSPPIAANLVGNNYCGIVLRYFTISSEKVFHTAKTDIIYDQNGLNPITSFANYYYDNINNAQPIRTEVNDSKGNIIRTFSRTALEKSDINNSFSLPSTFSAAIDEMLNRNMVGTVLQQEQYLVSGNSSALLKRVTNQSKLWTNNFIQTEKINVQNGNNPAEYRLQLNQYDAYGNINEQQKVNDVKEVYLYGYNFQYPVAKIIGADYSTVNAVVQQSQIDAAITADMQNGTNGSNLRSLLNNLRTNSATSSALVTSFTYLPLIGMNSQTDAAGHTSFYEYDALRRIKLIRDQYGNITKVFGYSLQSYARNTPIWQSDGLVQCKPCSSNSAYTTNIQQHHEIDVNPSSSSYLQDRWVDDNVAGNCVVTPDFQTISSVCEQIGNVNSGNLIITKRDNNPCSSPPNQTTTTLVYNTSACPLPVYIPVVGSNSLSATFRVTLTSTSTGINYTGNISYTLSSGDITLMNVPAGTYNVAITPLNNFNSAYSFQIGAYAISGSGSRTIWGVSINASSDAYILIDPAGGAR